MDAHNYLNKYYNTIVYMKCFNCETFSINNMDFSRNIGEGYNPVSCIMCWDCIIKFHDLFQHNKQFSYWTVIDLMLLDLQRLERYKEELNDD